MKILILNSMGRSGTTMLQDAISTEYNLSNLGEYLRGDYDEKLKHLASTNDWVCKYFVEYGDTRNHLDDISFINPDLIVVNYRNDLIEQYLSFQISLCNDKWNSTDKLSYSSFEISDLPNSIDSFFHSIILFKNIIAALKNVYNIEQVSYEEISTGKIPVSILKHPPVFNTVKQNTMLEKISLVKNYNQVKEYWDDKNYEYHFVN